jgi:hypothetical protein
MSKVTVEFNTDVPRSNLIIEDDAIKKVYYKDTIIFYTTSGIEYEIKKDTICFTKEENVDTVQYGLQRV